MAYVIKSNEGARAASATPFSTEPRQFELQDWSRKADEVLNQVRAEARRILEAARQEAESIRAAARREGLEAARQEAKEAALQVAQRRLDTLIPALQQCQQQLEQARGAFQRRWETQLIQLAAAIAERIIRRELEHQPEVTLEWIREAIELATRGERMVIRLHAGDVESLRPHLDEFRRRLGEAMQLEVVPDHHVDAGTCVVETPDGRIDYRLPTQLARVVEELTW